MPRRVDRNGGVHALWPCLAGESGRGQGPVLLSAAQFLADWEYWLARIEPFGLRLSNTDDFSALEPFLARLPVIALEFPVFTDGRAYSQARRLRTRHGCTGELWALGAVAPDQAREMFACGFDALELKDGIAPSMLLARTAEIAVEYQPWLKTA